jgi:hypothetical protein
VPKMEKIPYAHGVAIDQEQRDDAAQRVFDELAASTKPSDVTYIRCGDMMVVGTKKTFSDGTVSINIHDCTERRYGAYRHDGILLFKLYKEN